MSIDFKAALMFTLEIGIDLNFVEKINAGLRIVH